MNASLEEARGALDWAEIRRAYEEPGRSVKGICADFCVRQTRLDEHVKAEGWKARRPRRTARELLVERLFKMLGQQVKDAEERMSAKDKTGTEEKEAKLLDSLARTLGKLIELETGKKGEAVAKQTRNMRVLRTRLAERIDQLKR